MKKLTKRVQFLESVVISIQTSLIDLKDNKKLNIHGIDTSILNMENWFFVEIDKTGPWIHKGDAFNDDDSSISFEIEGETLYLGGRLMDGPHQITSLRIATEEDLERFFEKYPEYSPAKIGDYGIFFDDAESACKDIGDTFLVSRLIAIDSNANYPYANVVNNWGHFFKVSKTESITQIKGRFLRVNRNK